MLRPPDLRIWWMPFRDGERRFAALAALGPWAPGRRRAQLEEALSSLRIAPGRTVGGWGVFMRIPRRWGAVSYVGGARGDLPILRAGSAGPLPEEDDDAGTAAQRRLGADDVLVSVMHLRGAPVPAALPGREALRLGEDDLLPAPSPWCAEAAACVVKELALRGWRLRLVVALGPARRPGDLAPVPPAAARELLDRASAVLATVHPLFPWRRTS